MHEIPTLITERVDDMPLLLEQRQRMGLPTWFGTHFPTSNSRKGEIPSNHRDFPVGFS